MYTGPELRATSPQHILADHIYGPRNRSGWRRYFTRAGGALSSHDTRGRCGNLIAKNKAMTSHKSASSLLETSDGIPAACPPGQPHQIYLKCHSLPLHLVLCCYVSQKEERAFKNNRLTYETRRLINLLFVLDVILIL